jgi:hypothetical protein
MGRLIPARTGMEYYRGVKIAGEDVIEEEVVQEPEVVSLDEGIPGYHEETRLTFTRPQRGKRRRVPGRVVGRPKFTPDQAPKKRGAGGQSLPAPFLICRTEPRA